MATQSPKAKAAGTWLAICVASVGAFEGLRTVAYKDPVGIPTICFGETTGVKMGDRATVEQCEGMLIESLYEANRTLERCTSPQLVAEMPQHTRAAYVSFIYNVGPGGKGVKDGFCTLKSGNTPTMRRLLVARQYEASCAEFPKWANPAWLRGLKIRRDAEQADCDKGAREWRLRLSAQ